ncbi:MAG: leucine-rich repeat domain-containing protein [Treponema sp.]|jgi:GH24 family phage-related lysozyme (muramidase)|nr:leucine-rich repeat domain-containing protein [Treponema sp.]
MNNRKTVLLAVCFSFLVVTLYGQNDGDFVIEGTTLVEYQGTAMELVIPANLGITEIDDSAFFECKNIRVITIPASVVYIGDDVFSGCRSLTGIIVDERNPAYSSADGVLFDKAKTTLIKYPEGKQSRSYTIPTGVTKINYSALCECENLKVITIPASVVYIGNNAFLECRSLTGITVDERNPAYSSADGVLFDRAKTTLIKYPEGKQNRTYTIPTRVTSIESGAFSECIYLTDINIPASVTSIGEKVFYGCRSIRSITIPVGVTSIGVSAFFGCVNLESITIPSSVVSIEMGAFYGCVNLKSVALPESIVSIGNWVFIHCSNLSSINIPASVTKIGDSAFYNTGLPAAIRAELVKRFGENVFNF